MQVSSSGIRPKLLFFAFLAVFCLALPVAGRAQAVQGWWLDQSGRAGIFIAPCGDKLCGRIEWLKTPLTPAGQKKTDIHNPDPALQGRPICGLELLWGFVPDGSGGWTGGWVYDPEAGKTYTSVMHLKSDGSLSVRGYIGIPLLGRSTIWTRPVGALPRC
jgi:uncharacterized protein (DUF2147 family)